MPRRKTPAKAPRTRKGMMPGEYRRRSTVYVERFRRADEDKRYGDDDLTTTDAYIVMTRRLDKAWTITIELNGNQIVLPGKVIDRILAHREAIITEGRSRRALDRHEEEVSARVKAEVEEAAGNIQGPFFLGTAPEGKAAATNLDPAPYDERDD